jgi:hypothetical protein
MTSFTQTERALLIIALVAGLFGCSEGEKTAPPPPPAPLTVGGNVSGLNGGEVLLQLNGGNDLTVNANGKFKFPKPLVKGGTYEVTVKTSPSLPVKQTCVVSQGNGSVSGTPVSNVTVTCTTNSYAVGGTVSGLAKKSKGLNLELTGVKEVEITKNGNFVFPDISLPDGSDYHVAIRSTPAGQSCELNPINIAPDDNTINIVSVTCTKKGHRK